MKNRFVKSNNPDEYKDCFLFRFIDNNRIDSFWKRKDSEWHEECKFTNWKMSNSYYFWVKDDSVK